MKNVGTSYDCTDKPPSSCHVTKTDLAIFMLSIILHIGDVGFDIYVAYWYFASFQYLNGALSVAFILIPSVVLATLSIKMYMDDLFKGEMLLSRALLRVILCIIGLPIQSATLIRIIDSFCFAIKSLNESQEKSLNESQEKSLNESQKKSLKAEKQHDLDKENGENLKEKYFNKMLEEGSDSSILKVFEAYLESAPQQVLQMTLLLIESSQGLYVHWIRQTASIVLSFISMGVAMANYNRCIRLDQQNKENVTNTGLIVHFLWHLLFTASRILSITAAASLYPIWTCVALGIHWFVHSVWLQISSEHNFCPSKLLDVLFAFTVGAVYIFNFLSLRDRNKKYYYSVFYFIIFLENTAAVVIWGLKSSFQNWIYYFFLSAPHVCFILGLIFMIVYYRNLHPTITKSAYDRIASERILFYSDDMTHGQRVS